MNRLEDMNIGARLICRQKIAAAYDVCRDLDAPTTALCALADAMTAIPLPEDDKEGK